ncbi:endonuclease/exonuclease/phosphatase family protein [Devosia geojensis]|uniref:endonuclease/exonuclease/phosphatase family protein n=1 Tax=Devosia geojensis TaxID=443610 RepID=UPI000696C810|nr:endonuclease/exonuclease/phosphatase family protein [Devosia geojensis]
MEIRGEVRGILTGFGLVAAVVVVAASGPSMFPGQPLLQSLRPHLGIALFVYAVIMVLAGARWRGLALAALAALSVGHTASIIYSQQQARTAVADRPAIAEFDLLSFNVLNYNEGNSARIVDTILARNPDVVILMEAAPVFAELPRLREVYPHDIGCEDEWTCDTLLLSKTPLEEGARLTQLSNFSPRRVIYAVSEIGGQRVNLVAVHMTKPYFDYQSEIEAHRLRQELKGLEGPVVIAGDFNAAPWSGNLMRLMRNADLLTGNAYPGTWPVELGDFGVPIDTMFTRPPAVITSIEGLPDPMGSNHRGIEARIRLVSQ